MYFPDLSPYAYFPDRSPGPDVLLNVGWLSAKHDYPRRPPDREFLASLKRLAQSPVRLTKGSHTCEFCPPPSEIGWPRGRRMIEPLPATGNGEIRVFGPEGRVFAAPALIVHYVEMHEYAPPDIFVEAVLRATMNRPRWSLLLRRLTGRCN